MSLPGWLTELADRAGDAVEGAPWRRQLPPPGGPGQRQSAVLMLFAPAGEGAAGGGPADGVPQLGVPQVRGSGVGTVPEDVSILLTERAHTLRSHPGQVSFPGGRAEPSDRDLVDTALRETNEEVGVEPGSVEVAGVLPPLNLVVSSHDVSPVLGWWQTPGRVWVREPREVARVLQVPVTDLLDPANRFRVGHPGGWVGPAFQAEDLVVWGFTALLLDGILRLAGWEVPWDESDVRPVP